MSTFKQIVEGYAGSVSNQHSAVDYEGASDRAVNKIRSEKLVKALGTSINHYNNVVRMYNKGIDTTNYDLSPGRTFGLHKTLNDFLNTTTLSEHDLLPVTMNLLNIKP